MIPEDKLKALSNKLKPTINDHEQYNAAFKSIVNNLDNDRSIKKAEIWKCGSFGKGTAIPGQSDIDAVVLMSPSQDMSTVHAKIVEALKGSSSIRPKITRRAVNVVIRDIPIDVLPTKWGIQGDLARLQHDPKQVATIVGLGPRFKSTVRILKHWRDIASNDIKGSIPSFGIEVAVAHLFRLRKPTNVVSSLQKFFDYVVNSNLNTSLALIDKNGKVLLEYDFNFDKKQHVIDQARHAQRLLNRDPIDLTFLGI